MEFPEFKLKNFTNPDDNEKKYGKEIREKYGDETINVSNKKIKGMTEEQHAEWDTLELWGPFACSFSCGHCPEIPALAFGSFHF